VIGAGGAGEVGLVAAVAVCRQRSVVVVYMALRARDADVRASKRERRVVVIKSGLCPRRGVVTGGAGGGESGADVVGIVGSGVIGFVASVAIRGQCCVVVVGVA